MGHEFLQKYTSEPKRMVWLIGVLFTTVLLFQYIEPPFGNVLSSLFSSPQTPKLLSNTTHIEGLNSTKLNVIDEVHEIVNTSKLFEGEDLILKNDSKVEKVKSNDENRIVHVGLTTNSFALPPIQAPASLAFPLKVDENRSAVVGPTTSLTVANSTAESSRIRVPQVKEEAKNKKPPVVSVSEMNDMLLRSHASPHSMKPRWSSAVDQELVEARKQILNAPITTEPSLYPPLYRNVSMFKRSYEIMEKTLKVYIYQEGKRPIFHQPALTGIYASEGWFMKQMEANKRFVTKDSKKAHLFYLPFSSLRLEQALYVPNSHSHQNLIQHLKNYLDVITAKYPFWNRTGGADHFLVACHDWAASETRKYMLKCIRALCNADTKEGFEIGKDVSLPETLVLSAKNPLKDIGGNPATRRPILAFYAGNMHGYLRPILLEHWENKDPDMKIYSQMPKSKGNKNYIQHMKSSKFCICPKGYEVNSPRVVEAIFYECVPVIISDDFVPPFFEVLNWESFAVFVKEEEVPDLKRILLSVSERRYKVMQQRVKKVQQHFLWHSKPVKYDIFHMILHSVWYNRVFQIRPR